ncbi:MAG: hypothetical protein K8S56_07770 [Candidatus Cloacimonetes bacterium]|nr:hypothetical protein [Candidatus Cloacimonadota bacterium]
MRALFTAKNALLIVILLCSMCSLLGWQGPVVPDSKSLVAFEWTYSPDKIFYEAGETVIVEYTARVNKNNHSYYPERQILLVAYRTLLSEQLQKERLRKEKCSMIFEEDNGPHRMLLSGDDVMTGYLKIKVQKKMQISLSFTCFEITDENKAHAERLSKRERIPIEDIRTAPFVLSEAFRIVSPTIVERRAEIEKRHFTPDDKHNPPRVLEDSPPKFNKISIPKLSGNRDIMQILVGAVVEFEVDLGGHQFDHFEVRQGDENLTTPPFYPADGSINNGGLEFIPPNLIRINVGNISGMLGLISWHHATDVIGDTWVETISQFNLQGNIEYEDHINDDYSSCFTPVIGFVQLWDISDNDWVDGSKVEIDYAGNFSFQNISAIHWDIVLSVELV